MDDFQEPVFFYEKEFYVFSNFSAFAVEWKGKLWMTSEHVYHSEKFEDEKIKEEIRNTKSAHDSLKLAHTYQSFYRKDWSDVKISIMEEILRAKLSQHPYIKKKLLETGNREIVEDSWRDDFWGWGPNKDGKNHLGKIWMKLRSELAS